MHITTTGRSSAVSIPGVSTDAQALMEDSTTAATRRAYTTALRIVDGWHGRRKITDATVANFLAWRHKAGASPATLRMACAAINFRYKLRGGKSPVGPLAKRALAGGVRSGAGRGRGQVDGVDFAQADAMAAVAANGGGSLSGLRDSALILIASDALLRVGEVAALRVKDVDTGDGDGNSASVTVTRSKTDTTGKGASLFIRARTALAVRRWLDAAGIGGDGDGFLFRPVHRRGSIQRGGLSARAVRRVIKRRASDAGVGDGKRVSGHSLRVGACGDLAMRGATLPALQEAGRWRSPAMAAHYARQGLAQQGAVARLRPA